ncbi:hypothetical protein D9613_009500 [Agrocybe pediades]|uniref:Ricin B lectin domain-containing protein n=1 Tax=Agrocybe pediades TaxID=84607 RepID=A0A8H4VW08_9AGAR|nr:hypothetical protein D9613_009500 [Agrocybe pediades]
MAQTRSTRTEDSDWESVATSNSDSTTMFDTPLTSMPTLDRSSSESTSESVQQSQKIEEKSINGGVYYIASKENQDMVLDVAGYDEETVLAYNKHGGDNQKWLFKKLGQGYSIQSMLPKQRELYLSIHAGSLDGGGMIVSPFPVSWEVEEDEFEQNTWKIKWPDSPFSFTQDSINKNSVQLLPSDTSSIFRTNQLWKLIPAEPLASRSPAGPAEYSVETNTTVGPLTSQPAVVSSADTIVDVEGLKLGGNGEMSITTTTTTVTTSVTKVKRIGMP